MSHWMEVEKHKSQLRNQALAQTAHEFRNPLNSMIQSLQLQLRYLTTERQRYFHKLALSGCKLMLFLVNDFMDIAQIESNSMVLNMSLVTNLAEVVAECMDILRF